MSEFERRKEYLTRSLFHDSPDLSTIQEEYYESSTAESPPLSLESHRSNSPCPPPAHCNGLWSPLPPLTIERVKETNKHDEPEDFYKKLHKKILKIYRRIFFEDRSDISDINTSDDDDEQTEPINYSTNSFELVETTHHTTHNNTSNNNENDNEPTSQSVNDITADQENHEDFTTAGTENQGSNEELELQINEPVDDENESHDDNVNYNDVDNNYLPNLETIFECDEGDLSNLEADEDISPNLEAEVESDEGDLPNIEPDDNDIPNLEANIESDVGRISSVTDVMPNSTQSEESRDSVTPLSSTVILSRGTSDEKLCLERNEVSANTTHHILPEAEEVEGGRTSPRDSTVSVPRAEANPNEDVNIEIAMEATADATYHSKVNEMEASIRPSTGSLPRAEADPHKDNENVEIAMEAENEDVEVTGILGLHEETPYVGDNVSMDIDPDKSQQSEVEEMRTIRPHLTGSPTFQPSNKKHPIEPNIVIVEHHAPMESDRYSENEEEMPKRPNTIENPDNLDIFDLIRISSPKEITEGTKRITNPDEYTANISSEDNSGDIPPEQNSGDIPPQDISGDIPPKDNSGKIEDNLGRNSPGGNDRKRKNDSPCHSKRKKVRFADKSVQTDDSILIKIVINIDINNHFRR